MAEGVAVNCPACERAAINPLTSHYGARCLPCTARALAQAPQHHAAATAQRMTTDYSAQLHEAFGVEWEAGHRSVKAWAERIKQFKQHKETHA